MTMAPSSSPSRSIEPLPEDVRAQITSTFEIRSLIDVAEQLFRNSLDARSNSVCIEVDFKKGYCSVTDDGDGIAASEFQAESLLAQAHCTSRHGTTEFYGRRGQALASISAVSLLSITSRQRGTALHNTTHCYTKQLFCGPVIADGTEGYEPQGTKVVVHNLFGNVPVRFKAQASKCDNAGELEKQFGQLHRRLVAHVLTGYASIVISLRVRGTSLSYIQKPIPHHLRDSLFASARLDHVLKQTLLLPNTGAMHWKMASIKANGVSIRMAILDRAFPSRRCQFISFGRWPVHNETPGLLLYDLVNDAFQSSTAAVHTDEPGVDGHRNSDPRQSVAAVVDRWPCFYIKIDCNDSAFAHTSFVEDRQCRESDTMQQIVALVKLLLKKSCATKRSRAHNWSNLQPSTLPRGNGTRLVRPPAASFVSFRKTKSAFPTANDDLCSGLPLLKEQVPFPKTPCDADVQLLLDDIELDGDPFAPTVSASLSYHGTDALLNQDYSSDELRNYHSRRAQLVTEGDEMFWTNPKNGRQIRLNDNSFVVPKQSEQNEDAVAQATSCGNCHHRLEARRWPRQAVDRKALSERLKQFPSQVFSSRTEDVFEPSAINAEDQALQISADIVPTEEDLSAKDLASAKALRQVDQKFILAIMHKTEEDESLLILVDQHAADERIKVERLYRELCSGDSQPLSRPIHYEVDTLELPLLDRSSQEFDRWGIVFRRSQTSQCAISVTDLPVLIAERCRQEPKILIDLIRAHIWQEDASKVGTELSLLDQIARCPRGLVEMINSRACRSAIMFNDVLDLDQCKQLLSDLSKCVLPFQCAHGRPSLTVLAKLGASGFGSSLRRNQQSFADAYKNWT